MGDMAGAPASPPATSKPHGRSVVLSSSFGLLVVLAVATVLVYYWRNSSLENDLYKQVIRPARSMLDRLNAALAESGADALDRFVAADVDEETRRVILNSARTLKGFEWERRPKVNVPGGADMPVMLRWPARDPASGVLKVVNLSMIRTDDQWRIVDLVVVDSPAR